MREKTPKPIRNIDELKKWCADHDGVCQCFVLLNGGFRSSKDIHHYPGDGSWDVFHYISDSWVESKDDETFRKEESFLLEAMTANAFFAYPDP